MIFPCTLLATKHSGSLAVWFSDSWWSQSKGWWANPKAAINRCWTKFITRDTAYFYKTCLAAVVQGPDELPLPSSGFSQVTFLSCKEKNLSSPGALVWVWACRDRPPDATVIPKNELTPELVPQSTQKRAEGASCMAWTSPGVCCSLPWPLLLRRECQKPLNLVTYLRRFPAGKPQAVLCFICISFHLFTD